MSLLFKLAVLGVPVAVMSINFVLTEAFHTAPSYK